MSRTVYAQPVDVLRKFDPTIVEADLLDGNDLVYGDSESGMNIDGMDRVYSRIEEVEDEFDRRTENPQRLTYAGGGADGAYYFPEADLYRYQGGVKLYLNHRNVMPIDAAEGDLIEVRTGKDSWRDITSRSGELYRLNAPKGILRLMGFYRFSNASWRRALRDDVVRVRYRHGALGGERGRSGESDLSSGLNSGDTTSASVTNAARFPRRGGVVLVGDEYVRYESADWDNNTLDTLTRGIRGTRDTDHSSGDTVHYCPMSVRSAVAAKSAVELITYEDWVDQLMESSGVEVDATRKVEGWEAEWERTLARFSEAKVI